MYDIEKKSLGVSAETADQDIEISPLPEDALHSDIAYGLYKDSLLLDPLERGMLAKTVRRKLDFILLPMVSNKIIIFYSKSKDLY